MRSWKRKNGRVQMLRLTLLTATLHAIAISGVGTTGAQKESRTTRSTESFSYEATIARLESLRPVDYYNGTGSGELYPWQYRNWHLDRCTLWFKDRWLVPSLTAAWNYTKVSLLDLNENATGLEVQKEGVVGVRLVSNGYQDRIMRYSARNRSSMKIASYYVNFGSTRKAQRVQKTLKQAIRLCKAQ